MQHLPVGVGVVGYGYWGPNLVRNFASSETANVIRVCDFDAGRLATCQRNNATVGTTTDFQDLLNDPAVEAIAVATPTRTHYDLALAALRAGKHVLVEKPLAPTSKQVRQLIDEAKRRNLVLMVDHTFLYTPAVQKIQQLISENVLGDVFYYNSNRASLGLFQNDVNVIWDLAVHDISIILHILNEKPTAVSATGVSHVADMPENMAHITLFFGSSCVAHINVNWLSPVKVRQIFIGGSRKMIAYDDLEPVDKIKIYDRGITVSDTPERAHQLKIGYRAGDMWAPHIPTREALSTEIAHFVDCIRTGCPPISSGTSGLHTIEILEAASRSIAAQGKPVRINHDEPALAD